jgi:prenyltransferase beta subunit
MVRFVDLQSQRIISFHGQIDTETSLDQLLVETSVAACFQQSIAFDTKPHIKFLLRSLEGLTSQFTSLDASKPWLLFWIFNSLDLMTYKVSNDMKARLLRLNLELYPL